jgi:hypothetical protein
MMRKNDKGQDAAAAAACAEVVDVLAGAVVELLLQRGPELSPDDAHSPREAADSATSRHIRGSP